MCKGMTQHTLCGSDDVTVGQVLLEAIHEGPSSEGEKKKLDICTVKGLWACQFRSGIKNKQTRLYKFPIPNTSLSPRTQCLVICPGWYTLHHHSLLQICFILYSSRECSQCKTWSYSFFTLHAFTLGKLLAATVGVMVMEVRRGHDPAGAVFAPLFFYDLHTAEFPRHSSVPRPLQQIQMFRRWAREGQGISWKQKGPGLMIHAYSDILKFCSFCRNQQLLYIVGADSLLLTRWTQYIYATYSYCLLVCIRSIYNLQNPSNTFLNYANSE